LTTTAEGTQKLSTNGGLVHSPLSFLTHFHTTQCCRSLSS
jgi:hypothetical protein